MHTVAISIAIALGVAGYVYILKSIQEQLQIQHDINSKLPPDKQFEPTFWGFGARERFRRLQKELLPESPRPRRLRRFQLIGFLLAGSGMLIMVALLTKHS